jgi:hypothetical protein
MGEKIGDKIKRIYDEYIQTYHRGREKFGVWWTLLTLSMLSLSFVFFITALILIIFFL